MKSLALIAILALLGVVSAIACEIFVSTDGWQEVWDSVNFADLSKADYIVFALWASCCAIGGITLKLLWRRSKRYRSVAFKILACSLTEALGTMRISRTPIIIVACFAVALSCVAEAQDVGGTSDCPFATVKLEVNMPRLEAERRISSALGEPNKYTPYANNLSGGRTKYESRNCTLNIIYAAGTPAPMVSTPGRGIEHMAPKDETVAKFELVRKVSPL